jgi:hypothetical protein
MGSQKGPHEFFFDVFILPGEKAAGGLPAGAGFRSALSRIKRCNQ